jgi:hypothetical protein
LIINFSFFFSLTPFTCRQSDGVATRSFISYCAATVRASQKRALHRFEAHVQERLDEFAAQGISTKAKKRKAAGGDEKKKAAKPKLKK